jgi:hypothetical protein
VSWHKVNKKWKARIERGGKKENLGSFATEAEAKARYDARCLELGRDPDAGISSGVRGVTWNKSNRKWKASITIDGEVKHLGLFEATARGEADAALAYDAAVRAAGRPEKANFDPVAAKVCGSVELAAPTMNMGTPATTLAQGTGREDWESDGHRGPAAEEIAALLRAAM